MSLTLRSPSYKKLETWKSLSRMPNGNYKNHVWCRTFKLQHTWNMQRRYSKNFQSLQFSLRSQEKCHLIKNQTFFLPFVPKSHAIEADFLVLQFKWQILWRQKKCCKVVRWVLSSASKKLNRLPLAGRLKFNTRCILYLPPNYTSQLTVEVLTSVTKQKLAQSIKMAYRIVHCFARVWMMIHLFYKFCSS